MFSPRSRGWKPGRKLGKIPQNTDRWRSISPNRSLVEVRKKGPQKRHSSQKKRTSLWRVLYWTAFMFFLHLPLRVPVFLFVHTRITFFFSGIGDRLFGFLSSPRHPPGEGTPSRWSALSSDATFVPFEMSSKLTTVFLGPTWAWLWIHSGDGFIL